VKPPSRTREARLRRAEGMLPSEGDGSRDVLRLLTSGELAEIAAIYRRAGVATADELGPDDRRRVEELLAAAASRSAEDLERTRMEERQERWRLVEEALAAPGHGTLNWNVLSTQHELLAARTVRARRADRPC